MRGHEVPGDEHLPGDLRVPALVRFQEGDGAERGEIEDAHGEKKEKKRAVPHLPPLCSRGSMKADYTTGARRRPRKGFGPLSSGFAVRPLRSGSSGNLMLVEHAGTVLLVDAGLPTQRGLAQALSESGYTWEDIEDRKRTPLNSSHG